VVEPVETSHLDKLDDPRDRVVEPVETTDEPEDPR
jgi:hypothetical protein